MTAVFAHRGATGAGEPSPAAAGVAPAPRRENTLAAFAAARWQGADGVELDVRLSADSVPVVHHDEYLPTGDPVAERARHQLPAWIPSLVDALDACAGLAVNIELKHHHEDPGRRLATLVAAAVWGRWPPADPWAPGRGPEGTRARVLCSSFDPASLAVLGRQAPGLPTGLLVDWRDDPERALLDAVALGCRSFHPFVTQLDAGLVARCGRAGVALHVWTVNADAELLRMRELGVAAVISDRVGAAVRILQAGAASNGGPSAGRGESCP